MARKGEAAPGKNAFALNNIFADGRGIFFDLLIFLVNVFLMRLLTARFVALVGRTDNDPEAAFVIALFCLGVFVLPPIGAILKRYRFHQRLNGKAIEGKNFKLGCLFNPIFYFCLNVVIVAALNAFILQVIYQKREPGEAVFVSILLGGLILNIVQTYIVYHFFTPPKREPKWEFLKDPRAEVFGDLCIFLNMLLFQVVYNALIGSLGFGPLSGIEDFFGRVFFLCFTALLIYFPPRMLFLAEDIQKPAAWLTILLANSPVIVRVLFGISLW
jgi:hypothetical protein